MLMGTKEEHNFKKTGIDTYQKGERMGRPDNKTSNKLSAPPQSGTMVDSNDLERSKYVYEQINGWITNADDKVSVSCGIFAGAFGVISFLAEQHIKTPDNPVVDEFWKTIYKGGFVISIILMIIAVYFYARAIIPNLKSSGDGESTHKRYPIFYGDIHSLKLEEYQKLMSNGTDNDFNDELVLESWYNSGICMQKMEWYKRGVIASMIAIVLALVSFCAHLLMYR